MSDTGSYIIIIIIIMYNVYTRSNKCKKYVWNNTPASSFLCIRDKHCQISKIFFVFLFCFFFKRPKRTTYFLNCKCPCFRSAGPCSPRRTCCETEKKKKPTTTFEPTFSTQKKKNKSINLLADEFSNGFVIFASAAVETKRIDGTGQSDQRPQRRSRRRRRS